MTKQYSVVKRQLRKKFPAVMKSEDSLPYSQKPVIKLHLEPVESSLDLHTLHPYNLF
jgi:hypothetical protein